MRKIFGIGETVLDIIFKEGNPQAAKAGGSMLNSVVSIGRAGLPVYFISELGKDDVGNLINNFLNENDVNTSYINRYEDSNTTLALAFLDDKNDARYTFYKNHHPSKQDIPYPEINEGDILICGSFYSIWSEIRERFKKLEKGARENGAMVIYDPNFRKSHLTDLQHLKPLIIENISMASIVRGSDEDFKNIFGSKSPDEAWEEVCNYCKCMIYTNSSDGVYVRTPSFAGKFPVKKIIPVSTIGAGDNFNAGMITSIYNLNIYHGHLNSLTENDWRKVISTAVDFASEVCLSYENYISKEFAINYKT